MGEKQPESTITRTDVLRRHEKIMLHTASKTIEFLRQSLENAGPKLTPKLTRNEASKTPRRVRNSEVARMTRW